jgi:hypothetical protein
MKNIIMSSSLGTFKLFLPLFFLALCNESQAQVGPPNGTAAAAGTALAGTTAYTFAQSSGTYTAITGGTQYQAGGTLNTDAVSAAVNIGFDFRYNNRTYSTVRISNNGFITFGANPALTTTYTGLSTNVNPAYEGAIAGFAANLRASAVSGAAPEIRYETLGSSPNRTFVVQYTDMGVSTTATTQRVSFQIRLAETTNVVSVVYGTTAWATSTATGQVGLKGGESSDIANRSGTNWTTIAAGTTATSSCTLGTTGGTTVPASGLTFTWTPGTTWGAASYATLPYLNDFATWTNGLNTADVSGSNMRTWPSRGDVTWRASNTLTSGFTSTTGWTGVLGQVATYSGAAVAPGARFHSYDCSAGSFGDMDFYVDMSTSPIGLYNVQFLHNNPTGTDVIQVFYSGDGGATFTQVGSNIGTAGNAWNTFSSNMAGTATSVIRVRATGDFGANDINIDNFRVTALTCAPPTEVIFTPTIAAGGTLSWSNLIGGTPANYEYEIYASGAVGLVASGTVAHPTNSVIISDGTLMSNTTYTVYMRTDCGGGDISYWSPGFEINTTYSNDCATLASLPTNLQDGIVGYWPFCGNANDESGNGNDGVVNGATLTEDRFGMSASAFAFNGVNSFIAVPDNSNGTLDVQVGEFSISCWTKVQSALSDTQGLVAKEYGGNSDGDYSLVIPPNGKAQLAVGVGSGNGAVQQSETIVADGNWRQITAVYRNGSEMEIYINGQLDQGYSYEVTSVPNPNTSLNLMFGKATNFPNNQYYLNGSLDDIAIWNRALTPAEVQELYSRDACTFTFYDTVTVTVENIINVFDTLTIENIVDVFDTSYVDIEVYDTLTVENIINVYDTLTIENIVEVYDTLTIENVIDVFDTTTVLETILTYDTLTIESVVQVYDTLTIENVIDIYDTTTVVETVLVYDTLLVENIVEVYDTTTVLETVEVFDTLTVENIIDVYDTLLVTVTDTLFIDVLTGVGAGSVLNTLLLYPNPTSDQLTIDYGNIAAMEGYSLSIFNNGGSAVHETLITQSQETLDISGWSAGVYQVVVYNAGGVPVETRQIVIQ